MYKYDIAASIVAYKNDPDIINNAIQSFLNTDLCVALLVIDNSPTPILKKSLIEDHRVFYQFNEVNVGFSKAHNQGIRYFRDSCKYFLVLNPDVYFAYPTLTHLFEYLENDEATGLIAPRVHYPCGGIQVSRRLIPAPADLIIRRIPFGKSLFKSRVRTNEYQEKDITEIAEVPFLLGCFMLFRMTVLEKVGHFDERFFVYLEDLDICRRLSKHGKVVYHGKSKIFHHYQRSSSKNLKMLLLHTISMIKYFNKWGWFTDAERKVINTNALALENSRHRANKSKTSRKYAATL